MKIVFFTHYFPPEGNAPASRTYEHCVRWVRDGHQVTVITCAPNVPNGQVYDGYQNRVLPQRETVDGIDVVRVWTYLAANAGASRRIANYVSYVFSSLFAFLFYCRRPDVLIATSPQFFCGWAGLMASWLKWCPFVLEIRDIWPESIVTVGAMKKGAIIRIMEVLEKWMYSSANHIIAVGEGYKQNILAKSNVANRISVVTNGVDVEQFQPQDASPEFLEHWNLKDRFICSYVGTIGMAHGLEITIEAARKLRELGHDDITFCLVGDGARRDELEKLVQQESLQSWVKFTGRLAKSEMPIVLASSDCLLIHLKKSDLFQTVIPSKIFEAMAMNRPLVMGVAGESADIVRSAGGGICIEPDNAEQLVEAVLTIKNNTQKRNELSQSRAYVAQHYTRDVFAKRVLEILEQVAKN